MKKFLTAMAILACTGSLALAGPNAGGTILVHYAPIPVPADPTFVDGGLTSCEAAVAQAPEGNGASPSLWFAYAAFPGGSAPRMYVISFGVQYDPGVAVFWGVPPVGSTEITAGGWPAPGSGNLLGLPYAYTAQVSEFYTFAGYGYDGSMFALTAHPDPGLGGNFVDDNPAGAQQDPIAGYGTLGFGNTVGVPACPPPLQPGACCFDDGHCEFVLSSACAGNFLGQGIACAPNNPCPVAWACCIPDPAVGYVCMILTDAACASHAGSIWYLGLLCQPDPCPTPTEPTSWGQIKNIYR